jgi:predicted ester cyclase
MSRRVDLAALFRDVIALAEAEGLAAHARRSAFCLCRQYHCDMVLSFESTGFGQTTTTRNGGSQSERRCLTMAHVVSSPVSVPLTYHHLRSVTSPEDQHQNRKRYCGVARADSIFKIDTDENVRGFLGRDEEDKKRKPTLVNQAIKNTLENNPKDFALLNSGVVIVAEDALVDDPKKIVRLVKPSIINGAQTKGVLEEYFSDKDYYEIPSISFELIVTEDTDLVAEISIARNYQNKVDDISIFGKRGRFDELEKSMQKDDKNIVLRKNETDFGDKYLDTEKLIQVITVFAPPSVEFPSAKGRVKKVETQYRAYAYGHRSRCLKDFAAVMDGEKSSKDAHDYCLSIASGAWSLYERLRREQYFSSLKKVKGVDVNGHKQVLPDGVPDGIVFPMMSALSRFVEASRGRSEIKIPDNFPWNTLFAQAAMLFTTTADHNPQTMGKNTDCYIALHGAMEMYFAATRP